MSTLNILIIGQRSSDTIKKVNTKKFLLIRVTHYKDRYFLKYLANSNYKKGIVTILIYQRKEVY